MGDLPSKLHPIDKICLQAEEYLEEGKVDDALVKYYLADISLEELLEDSKLSDADIAFFFIKINRGIGLCYEKKGKHDKAVDFLDKAFSEYQTFEGEDFEGLSKLYWQLGIHYYEKGYLTKGFDYFERIKEICSCIPEDLMEFTEDEVNHYRALCHAKKGDYATGFPIFEESLKVRIQMKGKKHEDVAETYMGLALCCKEKKTFKQAVKYLKKARRIYKKQENYKELLKNYIYLGDLCLEHGKIKKALKCFKKGFENLLKLTKEENKLKVALYSGLGRCLVKKRKYEKAEKALKKALKIAKKALQPYSTDLALLYSDLGKCYECRIMYAKALRFHQRALIKLLPTYINENIYNNPDLGNGHLEVYLLQILNNKANAFYRLYQQSSILRDLKAAYNIFDLVTNLINSIRRDYKIENSKLFLATQVHEIYDIALNVSYELYNLTHQKEYLDKCFILAEIGQSYILLSDMKNNDAKIKSTIPASLLKEEENLRLTLNELDKFINIERAKKRINNEEIVREKETLHEHYHKKYQNLINHFEKEYPDYYQLKYDVETTTIDEVKEYLGKDSSLKNTAVIEYFVGNNYLYIYFLTKDSYKVIRKKHCKKFEKYIENFQKSVKEERATKKHKFISAAYKLYKILFPKEIRILIKIWRETNKNHHLIIIPDEELAMIPFEALLTRKGKECEEYSDLPYLIKDYQISNHYSATLWVYGLERERGEAATRDFLGIAPVYKATKSIRGKTTEKNEEDDENTKSGMRSTQLFGKKYKRLVYSEEEVNNITKAFLTQNSKFLVESLLNGEATENNFKINAPHYKYILISAHGEYNASNPELTTIIFSPNNAQEDYSLFNMADAYNLKINAELVVLSCCEMGVGRVVKGEGVLAMNRGFLHAGAANVVYTLFKVYDKHSAELTQAFFQYILEGFSFVEALQKAKLDLIEGKNYKPVYWAGFVLIGN